MSKRKPTLAEKVAEMERTCPAVAAAAFRFEEAKRRILENRIHAIPCTDPNCEWHRDP